MMVTNNTVTECAHIPMLAKAQIGLRLLSGYSVIRTIRT